MASIICHKDRRVRHTSVVEVKHCYGLGLPSTPTPPPPPVVARPTYGRPRLENTVFTALLDSVPDGRYAWQPSSEVPLRFIRLKRYAKTARNRFAGATIVQTQHSDDLKLAWVWWPSGQISVYDNGICDLINGVIVDYKRCRKTYSEHLNQCGICGKTLTDERSRHYGIGPDCETRYPEVIDEVDDQNDGRTYEQLHRR